MVKSTCLRGGLWDYKHIPNGLRALNWFAILVPTNAGSRVASSRAGESHPVIEFHCLTWRWFGDWGSFLIVHHWGVLYKRYYVMWKLQEMFISASHLYHSFFLCSMSTHQLQRMRHNCTCSYAHHPHMYHHWGRGQDHTHSVLAGKSIHKMHS